jgi:hypothetical protein
MSKDLHHIFKMRQIQENKQAAAVSGWMGDWLHEDINKTCFTYNVASIGTI